MANEELTPLEALENIKKSDAIIADEYYSTPVGGVFEEELAIIETALKDYESMKQTKIIVADKKISDDDLEKLKNQRMLVGDLGQCEIKPLFDEETQNKLKAFKIIVEKEIDIWLLKVCDYENYCRIRTECLETNVESMADCDKPAIPLPSQEEFDLLKEVLE